MVPRHAWSSLSLRTLLLSTFLLTSCGDSTSPAQPAEVVVSPNSATLGALEMSRQFSAVLEDQNGRPLQGVSFTWSTTDPQVASVSSTGEATAVGPGTTTVQATAQGITGSATLEVAPVPSTLAKVAGDVQTGAMSQVLPASPTVEIRDANAHPVAGIPVTFSVLTGDGSASQRLVLTGADGRASTEWRLGCSDQNPQRLEASYAGLSVEFTATADLSLPAICIQSLPRGRAALPYSATLTAAGDVQGPLSWEVSSGALPAGLFFKNDGEFEGTPTESGTFAFTVTLQDGQGLSASRAFSLQVCAPPLALDPGAATDFSAASLDECGFFIPTGDPGDRYRIGAIYASSDDDDPSDLSQLSLAITKVDGVEGSPPRLEPHSLWTGPRTGVSTSRPLKITPSFLQAVAQADAQEAFSHRMRRREQELLKSLGPLARPLPDLRGLQRSSGPERAAANKIQIRTPDDFTSCALGSTTSAVKIAENTHMVIYQDSAQNAATPLNAAYASKLLNHFREYGTQVLDRYFGGLPDTNADGQAVLLVTPVVDQEEGVAFVWSGDLFPRSLCSASNEMELMRFSLSFISAIGNGNFMAITTTVHEAQHIASQYQRIQGNQESQPLWVGEGTAEIAAEVSARLAWADAGGPGVGERVGGNDIQGFTEENYRILLVMFRTSRYLNSQPNGITVTPEGATSTSMEYGAGWHLHRWLGDAYGGASTPFAEAPFFRAQIDQDTESGVSALLSLTGEATWADLLGKYASAVMLNGTGAPQDPLGFTTYDFVSLNDGFSYNQKPEGDYPWPVNTSGNDASAAFSTVSFSGALGPGGLRVYDFTSTGTGLGLEVHGSASRGPLRLVVARLR